MTSRDLLLEIGVEELPSSFVDAALKALPELVAKKLKGLRLPHGDVRAIGTARRLAVLVASVAEAQPDLAEELSGPPVSAAFDKEGKPTKAGEAFAKKAGVEVAALSTIDTPKGKYLAATRKEQGRPAVGLLGDALAQLCGEIPFRKSMRWGASKHSFGRPVRWLVALYGSDILPFEFAGMASGRSTVGHRFLAPANIDIAHPSTYEGLLAEAHVLVDPKKRAAAMASRLEAAAAEISGVLIADAFLAGENLSLVEEPHVITGSFEARFLALPEEVVLEVARGHQRYFGVRDAKGALLPRYLAVVNTANDPTTIARGNDRVMRARLSDAQFFFDEDKKSRLESRIEKLDGIVFHNRLGSVAAKVRRVSRLVSLLGARLGLDAETSRMADRIATLAKCDLVTLMVGEFPELQGVMGRAYALAQGEDARVADGVRDHYRPQGAKDSPAPTDEAALVALSDRLDTLVGCFAVGLSPTGAADPYALRRACLGVLRTLQARGWDLAIDELIGLAYPGLEEQTLKLDLSLPDTQTKLGDFFRERLRNLLADEVPGDVVDACLAVGAARPLDVRARALALATLDPEVRAKVGEVFKRVANIAKEAPPGEPVAPSNLESAPHASETALFDAHCALGPALTKAASSADFPAAFAEIASFAPKLAEYFLNVFVMAEEAPLRENRLRTLRAVRDACSTVAHFQLLQG